MRVILRTMTTVYLVGVLLVFGVMTFNKEMGAAPTYARVVVSLGWPFAIIEAAKMMGDGRGRS